MSELNEDPSQGNSTRRTIIQGAAWSVPVIALAAASPATAASGLRTYTFTITGNGTTGRSCTFTLPPSARDITYNIAGASGGGSQSTFAGNGHRLRGTIAPPAAPVSLQIVAGGHGGHSPEVLPYPWSGSAVPAPGGTGWGAGGAGGAGTIPAPATSTNGPEFGGGGGAGSALVIGGTAILVAAGGGGAGAQGPGRYLTGGGASLNTDPLPGGAASGGVGGNTVGTWRASTAGGTTVMTSSGGGGATVASGGAAGNVTFSGLATTAQSIVPGAPGTAGTATAPGTGGAGQSASVRATVTGSPEMTYLATSGGGGGGYSGGGSGGAGAFRNTTLVAQTGGGSGGAGASYIGTTVGGITVTNTQTGVGGVAGYRTAQPGSVTITFSAPAGLDLSTCGTVV